MLSSSSIDPVSLNDKTLRLDHHYVPQCYLRKFLPTGLPELYYLSTDVQSYKRRVRRASPKSVCFEPGLYKIETDEVRKQTPDGDSLFIERRAFPYEKKEFMDLIDVLKEGRPSIISVRAKRLVSILMDIKRRNIYVRDALTDAASIEGFKQQYLKEVNDWVIAEGQTPEVERSAKVHRENLHRKFSDERFRRDLFRSALISNIDRPPQSVLQVLKQVEDYRFEVARTDMSYPLITSDNPGFCLMSDNSVYPLKFSNDMTVFCFPLTPTMLLSLVRPAESRSVFKSITMRKLPPEMVTRFNIATLTTSNHYVYSNSKSTLEELIPYADEIARNRKA